MQNWNAEIGAFTNKLVFHPQSKDCLPGDGIGEIWNHHTPQSVTKNWRRKLCVDPKKLSLMTVKLGSELATILIMTGHAELYQYLGMRKHKKNFKRRIDLEKMRAKLIEEEEQELSVPMF